MKEKEHIVCNDKLFLQPITLADTEMVLKWRNSEFVKSFFIYQKNITTEEHLNWLEQKVFKGKVAQFIIINNNIPIGSVYLQDIDYTHNKAEFGIFIGDMERCGNGTGTMVAKAMLHYAFAKLHLHKVYLRVLEDNLRAIHCYEKAGFQREACLVDDVRIKGKYRNIVIMSIINA